MCALQAQPPASVSSVSRIDLLKQVLPAGDYRNVQASVVEFAPGAAAMSHRHDVAVVVYVIKGEVENQLGAGPLERRRQVRAGGSLRERSTSWRAM